MATVACTLFEGHYHYGVAALVNSLYKQNFRGRFYAGYKGVLPAWACDANDEYAINGKMVKTLSVATDLKIHFIAIDADYHLTNYKPDFMISLFDLPAANNIDGIVYFDPDIVVKINWAYFEEWITYGVALVHEVSSNDMPPTHPKRKAWEKVIAKNGRVLTNHLTSYINAGFCGVNKTDMAFLFTWKEIFQTGVAHFGLSNTQWKHGYTQDHVFFNQDQDAMNIAAMCSPVPLSAMGPEAMDFVSGGYVMSHLVGRPKPWNKNMFKEFMYGKRLTLTDRLFWQNVIYPIKPYKTFYVNNKKASIKITSFLSRFYSK